MLKPPKGLGRAAPVRFINVNTFMQTLNVPTAPSITLGAVDFHRRCTLPWPLVVMDADALPQSFRIDATAAYNTDDFSAAPGAAFSTPWRTCSPGALIVVAAKVTTPNWA